MPRVVKIFAGLVLMLVIGSAASAQETYSIPVTAGNVVRVDRQRVRWNTSVCVRFALVASCTQAQACVPAGVVGGASCTVANARAEDVEIFANTQAGRELFFIHQILVKLLLPTLKEGDVNADYNAQRVNWNAGNNTVKDAMCAAALAPVPASVALGCNLYP